MVLCKLFYDSFFYVATGTSSYCVYYYYWKYKYFLFSKITLALILFLPLNTILHSSHRSSEAGKIKQTTTTKKLYNGILSTFFVCCCFVYCCYSHECGIIAFYIYVELLYAYIYIVCRDIYHTFYDCQCLCWYNFEHHKHWQKQSERDKNWVEVSEWEIDRIWPYFFLFK